MEESAQRKERLKAMRMEASQEASTYVNGNDHSTGVSRGLGLSNPLIEPAANPDGQVGSSARSFNYYTDPMAAFSANKRRSKVNPQTSQDFSSPPPRSWTNETFSSPAPQPHISHSPDQRLQYANPNYVYNPSFGSGYPGSGRGGYPSPRPYFSNSPSQGSYHSPSHGPGHGSYPSPKPPYTPGTHFSNTPSHGSGQGGYPSPRPYTGYVPGPSPGTHFRNSPSHGSGQGGHPGPGQGRGRWSGPMGRGRWSGPGPGRGRGHVSAEDRPDLFYNRSMVEDPWKLLEPVIWRSSRKSWLPDSLGGKRSKVSEPTRRQPASSEPSLAEILAASFNEAAGDEP